MNAVLESEKRKARPALLAGQGPCYRASITT